MPRARRGENQGERCTNKGTTMRKNICIITCLIVVCTATTTLALEDGSSLEYPDVFAQRHVDPNSHRPCGENEIVAAWCDTHINLDLDCAILPEFDMYACSCMGNPALCPTECIGGNEEQAVMTKTHSSIQCRGIPIDNGPNYILKETHILHRCENNAAVAAWCDDYVNQHLECHMYPTTNQYTCTCTGKHSYCPDECIGGIEPILKTGTHVICNGIPEDTPNYILKDV